MISNWENVEDAVVSATEATGSASEEHEKYVDSIEGRMNQLESSWQTFSNAVISSDFMKAVITGLKGILDVIEKIVSVTGGFGAAGLIGGVLLGFNKRQGISNILSGFVSNLSDGLGVIDALKNSTKKSMGKSFGELAKDFVDTGLGKLSIAGGVAATIASVISSVRAWEEDQQKKRQETIDSSNAFLDSFGTFEQAYIKYADKNALTVEEESELAAAINGTVSALGDKSAALSEAVGLSSEYASNLDTIAKAEAEQLKKSAAEAKVAAKGSLDSAIKGKFLEGKPFDIKLPTIASKDYEVVKDLMEDENFKKLMTIESRGRDGLTTNAWIRFNPDDSIETTLEKYNAGIELQERFITEAEETGDEEYLENTYKSAGEAVDGLNSHLQEYMKQTYATEKANYQAANGMANTTEEFYAMREAILQNAGASVQARTMVGDMLNEEYKDVFDTSSVESKMDYIESVTKGISDISGTAKERSFETALDMKTKVNDGDVSIGDYVNSIEEASSAIDSISDVQTQEFLRVQLGIEFDEDGNIKDEILKTRNKFINDLENAGWSTDIAETIVDGLSKQELEAAINLSAEGKIDLKNMSRDDIVAAIENEARLNEAISFTVDIEIEKGNIENLNTAISESVSGSGLSDTSIAGIDTMFAGLAGYDKSKLFERSATGMRLNTAELRKMNSEYKKTNLDKLENRMDSLGDKYNQTRMELSKLSYGTDEYNTKLKELGDIESDINDTEKLTAQFKGLTSAYAEWQAAEASGTQRSMYESVISGFDTVDNELSRGWVDDGTIEFIELLSGKNLSTAGIDEIKSAWDGVNKTIEGTGYTARDFFTVNEDGESTSHGVYNFLEAIDDKFAGKGVIQRGENNEITGFDFKVVGGDKAIAQALGISEELVEIIVGAADDAGFVISMDGTYQQLDVLKEKAQESVETLKGMQPNVKELEGVDLNFDFNVTDAEELNAQLEKSKTLLDAFRKSDGTIDFDKAGAKDAYNVASTFQSIYDKASRPAYMDIKASEVERELQKPLGQLQQYRKLVEEEHQLQLNGADTSEIQKNKDEILDYFQDIQRNKPELAAELEIQGLSREELEAKFDAGEIEIPATIDIQMEMNDNLSILANKALLDAGIIDQEEYEKRVKVILGADVENEDAKEDVQKGVEEVVEEGSSDENKVEVKNEWTPESSSADANLVEGVDISLKPESIDTSKLEESNLVEGVDTSVEAEVDFKVNTETDDIDGEIQRVKSKIAEINNSNISPEIKAEQIDGIVDDLNILIQKKIEASQPAYMQLDTSQVKSSMVEMLTALQNYQIAYDELSRLNQLSEAGVSIDSSQIDAAKTKVEEAAQAIQNLPEEAKVAVGFEEGASLESIMASLGSGKITLTPNIDTSNISNTEVGVKGVPMNEVDFKGSSNVWGKPMNEVDFKGSSNVWGKPMNEVDFKGSSNVWGKPMNEVDFIGTAQVTGVPVNTDLESAFTGIGQVTMTPKSTDMGPDFRGTGSVTMSPSSYYMGNEFYGSGTVTITKNYVEGANAPANGTAHVGGTAFADGTKKNKHRQGDWRIGSSGVALGGELGQEIVVRDGRFFTIGDNGAEFFKHKPGDIIFNHKQTEELFKNGYVTSGGGRGRMFANGTAFAEGSAFAPGSSGSGGWGRPSGGYKPAGNGGNYTSGSNNNYTSNSNNNNTYNYNYNSSSGSSSSASGAAEEAKDEFEETVDFIEIAIDRIERAIKRLDTIASSTYKTWGKRNSALADQIGKVREEIDLQQRAYDRYMSQANSVGLSESYASQVRDGSINIEVITDEGLKEQIDEYQEWINKAYDAKDAIDELNESVSELYEQRFDNVITEFEGYIGVIQHEKNVLEEIIAHDENRGFVISTKYYERLRNNLHEQAEEMRAQREAMLDELHKGVDDGSIEVGSEAWYNLVSQIDEVTESIYECKTEWWEFWKAAQEADWAVFDMLQEKISGVAEESEFLIELMSNKKLFEDNGQLTDEGKATMGLHGVNYNTYMAQADKYAEELRKMDELIASDPEFYLDQDLVNRRQELLEMQQESILNAEKEKDAIKDLVEEGIDLELDALDSLIEKYVESLDVQKDLYDYQRKVKEQTQEIAALEKQLSVLQGDDSEENRAKLQELKEELESAREDLEETEYDKYVDDQKKLLDELYISYEEILNQRLDNIDQLITEMITEINNNSAIIGDTIREQANNVGYTVSESMDTIFTSNMENMSGIITMYGDGFNSALTTVNSALNNINVGIRDMIAHIDRIANERLEEAGNSSATNHPDAYPTPAPEPEPEPTPPPEPPKEITVGGMINASGAWIYADSYGGGRNTQLFKNDPIYTVISERNGYVLARHHSQSSGYTGWFWKGDVSAYATGKKLIDEDEMAWTQERGNEMIVRPSDGAILTPLAKGDSVLNATATGNIWDMANSPADFIRDNLSIGNVGAPIQANSQSSYNQTIENVSFVMPNVKNYEQMLSAMQRDKNFERLVVSMSIDKIAGKSSLRKGKSIR